MDNIVNFPIAGRRKDTADAALDQAERLLMDDVISAAARAQHVLGMPQVFVCLVGTIIHLAEQQFGPGAAVPYFRGGLAALSDNDQGV